MNLFPFTNLNLSVAQETLSCLCINEQNHQQHKLCTNSNKAKKRSVWSARARHL